MNRTRNALLAASAAASLLLTTQPAGATDTDPPLGTCVDFLYYDGIDTRPSAGACRDALEAAGYAVRYGTNTDAHSAVADLPREAVYFHSGHSLDAGGAAEGTHIAIASMYESSTAAAPFSGTLGDPAAIDYSGGTVTLCKPGGAPCKAGNLVLYPHASLLRKVNLAVFEDCATAYWNMLGYKNMAQVAYDAGAGTSIGFKADIGAPAGDPWAMKFWSDLRNGTTYSTALVNAANSVSSVYRFNTYYQYHHSDAPTRLRPAGFYVPSV